MEQRPNILFLMSDQHRADIVGYEGNSVIRTPVLDQLARTGIAFRHAYTPSPICIPGRQCLMAGQLPESCDCRSFGEDLAPNHMTFARRLSQYAYNTVCVGKLHHLGIDQMQGWTTRLAADTQLADRYIDGRVEAEFERYRPWEGTGKWTNQKEVERAGIGEGPYQQFDASALAAARHFVDRYFTDPMYDRPGAHRPLLLKLSLMQPHYPFFTDAERFTYYLNRVPVYDAPRSEHPVLSRTQCGPPVEATPRDRRRATAAYYGLIDRVDQIMGALLDRLRHVGQDPDDWLIIYTTDHGEMLGEHGIWEKTQFYEGSVRVPLIIRWPRRFPGGRTIDQNVSLCDLFATICECCGIPVPDGLDSRSLVPLLEGRNDSWDNECVSQIGRHRVMIKRDALKYLYFGAEIPEVLFDLSRDPGENTDVSADPRYADALTRFRARLGELGHGPPPVASREAATDA